VIEVGESVAGDRGSQLDALKLQAGVHAVKMLISKHSLCSDEGCQFFNCQMHCNQTFVKEGNLKSEAGQLTIDPSCNSGHKLQQNGKKFVICSTDPASICHVKSKLHSTIMMPQTQ